MEISPDLFNQYVNRKQYDMAQQSLDRMREDGYHFKNFTSTNTLICLIKLALNTESLTIPMAMLAGYNLAPHFNQLLTCLPMECRKHLEAQGDDQATINRVSQVCIDIITAASQSASESLRIQTFDAFINKLLLHTKLPRYVGMKGEAFKPHRDLYFGADLGL